MNYAVRNVYGKIKNPCVRAAVEGSKSITARALLLAALAKGESVLYGAQFSQDCQTFINALNALGIKTQTQGTTVKISGCGGNIPVKNASVFVGSAGTAARFLPAVLAFQSGEYTLTCSEQMKKRPQKPLIRALQALGARFEFLGEEYCYPFKIYGTATPAKSVEVDVSESSQFLSALLMASACAVNGVEIAVLGNHGTDYVNMTLDMMWSFGLPVMQNGEKYFVRGGYLAKRYDIEPDVSAACYFYAANKILGTQITVNGVTPHTMQGDYKFIKLLEDFQGGVVDMSSFSDQALTLAAIAPYLKTPTTVTGVAHIRRQECDRIKAAVHNLNALGVRAEEREDGFTVYPTQPHGAEIETFGDHRVAMAFAVTGLRTSGVVIKDAEVCAKTFESYFKVLDDLIEKMT